MHLRTGDQFILNGQPFVLSYINEGRQRLTLIPLQAHPPAKDEQGKFVHSKFLNEDPVFVAYEGPDGWLHTEKPQTVKDYAYGSKLAVCGEEPFLYGIHFVECENLFLTKQEAEHECARRNNVKRAG